MNVFEELAQIQIEFQKDLKLALGVEQLDYLKIKYMGRSGLVTNLLRKISSVQKEDRPKFGAEANKLKSEISDLITQKIEAFQDSGDSKTVDYLDVTLPGRGSVVGALHPTTQIVREICDIFVSLGFSVIEGPEIEFDKYNFEMLNIPKGHPARDMWSTMWIENPNQTDTNSTLLRTHTSPMQARFMETNSPPIRIVVPGKCYRYEATDATHEWHFYQIEGLVVDKGINFSNLKGTLYEFAKRVFGNDRKVRFRCDYFPFVEPGVDMSISNFKDSEGNRPIKGRDEDWIEILGAGMVHPEVLRGVGYDPDIYTGFAFGMGPERISMLRDGIDDIRHFYSNDLRFLGQFV
jgi:phenylalanyl-tRNA synthetase alpha chain|tara:strand:+ start:2240 stop:3286 length:1047 start_codon:yes stop_codon:yes gene_type:complete